MTDTLQLPFEELFDVSVTRELVDIAGPDAIGEILDAFLSDLRGGLDRLALAEADLDRDELQLAAHALAGIALSFGAALLGNAARSLEAEIRNAGRADIVLDRLATIRRLGPQTCEAVEDLKRRLEFGGGV